MNKFLLYCLFMGIAAKGFSQTPKRASFETAVKNIVTAVKQKNNAAFKKYVEAKTGFYLLYRNGVFDQYTLLKNINLSGTGFPEAAVQYSGKTGISLRYGHMPAYTCDTDKWSKTGAFADTSGKLHQLSQTARDRVKYEVEEIPEKKIKALEVFEKGNWKVIVADKNGQSFIFYLMYKNNRWYISIIDTVTTDCSA